MASGLFRFILLYCCHSAITEACNEGWFGSSCQYKCHCLNNECDSDGRCVDSSTCEPGWFGPLCQYYDLAQRKSSVTPRYIQTTDNNDTTCSSLQTLELNWSIGYQMTWFRIVLAQPGNLQDRLSGFVLVTRDRVNRVLFTFTDPPVNMDVGVYNITSITSVAATNTQISVTTFLTLCEVEIYGDNQCSQISFGLECNMNCNCMNKTETCFVATGGCRSGCAAGYQGEGCLQECSATTYGINCSMRCSINCVNQRCHHIYCSCEECVAGRQGAFCEEGCVKGLYGDKCQYNEDDLWCNKFNGTCVYGLSHVLQGNAIRRHDDRLAEGIGIGIGIMCVVFLIVAVIVFIIRRRVTTSKLTVEKRKREQESETTAHHSHTENIGPPPRQSPHQYDEITLDTGSYDHITPHNTLPSQYECVDINTENSNI